MRDTGTPYTRLAVITRNAAGWIGTRVPGGSTGRCTPFWPPLSMNAPRLEKLPNAGRKSALLAPILIGLPTWAMTTPISPAGTCTQGCLLTP